MTAASLFEAIRGKDEKKIRTIVAKCPGCVNEQWSNESPVKQTCIHVAATSRSPAILRLLVELGADVNAFCSLGGVGRITAAHLAAFVDDVEMLKTLKELGCNMSEVDCCHNTPLDEAKRSERADAIKYLTQLKNKNDETQ